MRYKKTIKVLSMIADDMKKDMEDMEGKPFNGTTVATQFGRQAAAITALSDILKAMLEERPDDPRRS